MEDIIKQEIHHLKNIMFNLEKLLKDNLPTRITGDGKRRQPSLEFKEITDSVEFLKNSKG
ncbi:hypothetical protein [Leptospira bandrabouensis]|uniref:hypothetical protein n=1 Tax=Leptospira bandrabouensis TaxID=2484903 RepID=UPI001EEC9336|nr:hypothetical protein [Leptospira bandrabouensis]MCG6152596.1 hypothetical protein [Leptospira bandrabouensis]